ncbi:MAG: hypothetical protein RIE56_07050 [Amphiplicatus sp.]
MPSDPIETILASDFARTAADLEQDGFAERTLERVNKTFVAKQALVWVAGGAGALIAGAQFAGMTRLFSPFVAAVEQTSSLSAAASAVEAASFAPQLLAAGAIAIAFAATALVLQGDR